MAQLFQFLFLFSLLHFLLVKVTRTRQLSKESRTIALQSRGPSTVHVPGGEWKLVDVHGDSGRAKEVLGYMQQSHYQSNDTIVYCGLLDFKCPLIFCMFLLLLGLGWNRDVINLDKIACLPSWKFGFGIIAEKCWNGMSSSLCFTIMNFWMQLWLKNMIRWKRCTIRFYLAFLSSSNTCSSWLMPTNSAKKHEILTWDIVLGRMERCDLNRSLALQRFGHLR